MRTFLLKLRSRDGLRGEVWYRGDSPPLEWNMPLPPSRPVSYHPHPSFFNPEPFEIRRYRYVRRLNDVAIEYEEER